LVTWKRNAIGSTSPSFHVVSTADFDGSGAKDILFRGGNGELVDWLLNSSGNLLSRRLRLAPPASASMSTALVISTATAATTSSCARPTARWWNG